LSRPDAAALALARRRQRRFGQLRLGLVIIVIGASAIAIAITASVGQGPPPGRRLAQDFARAWGEHDWRVLYGEIDSASRLGVGYSEFAEQYSRAWSKATVIGARAVGAARLEGDAEVVNVRVHTRAFGTFRQQFILPLSGSGSATKIAWHPNLVFPGLYAGEVVHRVVSAPRRGLLLARDYVPLTSVASAANVIGSIGNATGAHLTALEARGFPGDGEVGLDGLEYVFQRRLGGRPGGELFAGPRLIAKTRPQPGQNVLTSIDPELQNDAAAAFAAAQTSGGIIVMEPRTGEILALAGTPLSEAQPPGSTFKMVTATGVLEAGIANINSTFPYGTYALIDGYKLHNSNHEDCGGTLLNAFAVSCNSVYAPLGVELGAPRLVATAESYGFNSPSPTPLAQESTLPLASDITNAVDLGSSAIGQYQDLATPLQMLRIAATIALGGREPVPTFATRVHPHFRQVIPVWVAHTIRKMMIAVVRQPDGTGVDAQLPGILVAGKTGTAQITLPSCPTGATGVSGTTVLGASGVGSVATPSGATGPCANIPDNPYDTDAWFVSFAPAFHPKIAVGVLLDHDGAGGTSAAPIARDLIAEALKLGY
jgi:peptidoglycan glycosyltransferase